MASPTRPTSCRFTADPAQADTNGDGLGDACTCGDVNATGTVSSSDEIALRGLLANPAAPLPRPALCNVFGVARPFPLDCGIDDWVVMRRARAGRLPGRQQVCGPALPP